MSILLHIRDLRVHDNPALHAALKAEHCTPVYVYDTKASPKQGEASKWFLHHSLSALEKEYRSKGSHLILRCGEWVEEVVQLAKDLRADQIHYNHVFDPPTDKKLQNLKKELKEIGVELVAHNGNYLFHPEEILNASKQPYSVFTPFSKACLSQLEVTQVVKISATISSKRVSSIPLGDLNLLPTISWDTGIKKTWIPGEEAAKKKLEQFKKTDAHQYTQKRDYPFIQATSQLSPHLHFGEISPHEIWRAFDKSTSTSVQGFLRQLLWREFGMYFLYHFPKADRENWREEFSHFPWSSSTSLLHSWQKGKTGYPIVDAGMRQLWQEGWMHNRVRMIVGSFLVKDLLLDWRKGAAWFWDTLVDADLANNTLGWQWIAGSGPDAAPYFRIFNPVLQSQKFDPNGEYIRKYLPELNSLPIKWIHAPWSAPEHVLEDAGIYLGKEYPKPIIDHEIARKRALEAFYSLKKQPPA